MEKNAKASDKAAPAKEAKQAKATKVAMYANLKKAASSLDAKKFRSKARRAIIKLANAVIAASAAKSQKGLPAAVKAMTAHYKKEYILNDFSVASVYTGKNEEKIKDLGRALKICKKGLAS